MAGNSCNHDNDCMKGISGTSFRIIGTVIYVLNLVSYNHAYSIQTLHSGTRIQPFVSKFQTLRTQQQLQPHTREVNRLYESTSSIMYNDKTMDGGGYGLSSTAQRIFQESKRQNDGYYKAYSNETVIDVMQHILDTPDYDIALIFDNTDTNSDQLLGIFTETDYIKYSTERANIMETCTTDGDDNDDTILKLLSPSIVDYITPFTKLVGLLPTETASTAISLMQQQNIRHVILTNNLLDTTTRKLGNNEASTILGVLSMKDVMSIIQKDERISLQQSLAMKYPNIASSINQLREELKNEANELSNNPVTAKEDIIKVGTAVFTAGIFAAFFSQSSYLHEYANIVMISIFVLGYIGIIFEEVFEFNKAGVALLMSTGLWVTYADYFDSTGTASTTVLEQLSEQLADVADICFFLLAASTIVEVVDSHQGFRVVTNQITTTSKKQLFWTIGFLTFFLSSILNNLTVTIVMVSLLRKLIANDEDRKLFGAMVVVAANAGGVWTPIGDVTTTMLWINNQLSTFNTITDLALPSIVCLVASLAFLVRQVEEDDSLVNATPVEVTPLSRRGQLVFAAGIACLLAVPVFTELTGLPPYLAMLTGLGAMWTLTDIIHMGEEEGNGLKVPAALEKLDTSGILFFLGILMSIGVLDKSGLLKQLAVYLSDTLPSLDIIATAIGLFSALIDNVPLVAATM
jgi:Na+/H+ antiporter NhaD/arsenite permease-like protein/CBS domain-containing protein